MDGFQFIASLVQSLVWPAVIALVIILIRKQLAGLAERVQELSFFGGKAVFREQLQAAREISQAMPDQPATSLPEPVVEENHRLVNLAIEAPVGAVILAYLEVEKTLRDIAIKLGMGAKVSGQRSVVEMLVREKLLTRDAARLFDTLREARNSAAHGVGVQPTTPEALEYIRQTDHLIGLLLNASAQLPHGQNQ